MAKFTLNLNGPLLEIPTSIKAASFDYVGRYQLLAEIITRYFAAAKTKPDKILDVGGLGSLLGQLLPEAPLVILDSEAPADGKTQEKQGDGAHMAGIKDGSYDVVVTSDTLEHIKQPDRKSFIAELLRVSDDLVVLCAPFNRNQGAVQEEARLQGFYANIVGEPDRWLREHEENGLPKEREVLSYIPKEFSAAVVHHSSLTMWRQLLSINLLANRVGKAELHAIVHKLNVLYNDSFMFNDFAEDSYRSFIIISKKNKLSVTVPAPQVAAADYLKLFQLASDFYLEALKDPELLPTVGQQVASLKSAQHALALQMDELKNSRSWKLTAPLRSANARKSSRQKPQK